MFGYRMLIMPKIKQIIVFLPMALLKLVTLSFPYSFVVNKTNTII